MQTQVGSLVLSADLGSDYIASAFLPGNQLRLLGKNRIRLASFTLTKTGITAKYTARTGRNPGRKFIGGSLINSDIAVRNMRKKGLLAEA
jgi:hypothetical protein